MFSMNGWLVFTRSRLLVFLSFLSVVATFSTIAMASCNGGLIVPYTRWRWIRIYWSYSGSEPTSGITAAANDWNSGQNFTTIDYWNGGPYNDIQISDDDNLGAGILAKEQSHNEGETGCYFKEDNTYGYCYDGYMMYYVQIWLNTTVMHQDAINRNPQRSDADETHMVVSHELGHAFGLNDDGTSSNCSNPSIMNYADEAFCGILSPQTCDTGNVYTEYFGWYTYEYFGGCNDTQCP